MSNFSLSRSDAGPAPALVLSGSLDASSSAELQQQIDALVNEGARRVIVDLAGLEFIDQVGVADLVGLYKRVHGAGGEVEIRNAGGQPRKIFELMRLDKIGFC